MRERGIEIEKEKERDHHKACLKHSMLCTDRPVMSKTSYCLLQNDKLSASDLCICLESRCYSRLHVRNYGNSVRSTGFAHC